VLPTRAPELISPEPSPRTLSAEHLAQIENAIKVCRFDLCRKFGETAPYRLLSAEEIKALSLNPPLSLDDLLAPPFLWSQERAQMIGEELVLCIGQYLTKHRLQRGEPGNPAPLPRPLPVHVDKALTMPSRLNDRNDPPLAPSSPASSSPLIREEGSRVAPFSNPTQPATLPLAAMKKRRSEALNASCGVGAFLSLLSLQSDLP
jgi:hypothetical protein